MKANYYNIKKKKKYQAIGEKFIFLKKTQEQLSG